MMQTPNEQTCLHIAVQYDKLEIVEYITSKAPKLAGVPDAVSEPMHCMFERLIS